MDAITATQARNRFREALAGLDAGPVAIERHGKPVAYLYPAGSPPPDRRDAARREARLRQEGLDRDRLIRHQRIALHLLSASKPEAHARVEQARAEVARWQHERLCSRDYIVRWRRLLALPPEKLAHAMCGDLAGWGAALRQNSPFA